MNTAGMKGFRVSRNCFEPHGMLAAKCPCCSDIKLLMLDSQERIRTIVSLTVEQLRDLLTDAESGSLPPFNVTGVAPHRTH